MPAGEDFHAGAGSCFLLVELRRPTVAMRKIPVAREHGLVERTGAGAVHDEGLSPMIEHVSVRIREPEVDVNIELVRARFITIDAGVGVAHRRAPRRLDLSVMKHALL